ncbi:MAG: hypothetical protein IJP89_11110 [Synergistaceae bacterium]|nr:hypothetical protein [Synergistaceae bacterium]
MNLVFPEIADLRYKSPSQRIRVLSETWMKNEMYCPSCGYNFLRKLPNNSKLADFICEYCGEIYELKSKGSPIGTSILDGAYYAAIERITSNSNPNLFVMRYSVNVVEALTVVPKYFFTPDVLKMRPPLAPTARRAGYVGSWIMYSEIPLSGKIPVIEAHSERDKNSVLADYTRAVKLKVENMNLRGWLMDIMRCIDRIEREIFSIDDIYAFTDELGSKHPDNHNISAKIRQQLQYLRDKGFIEFLGKGIYRKTLISQCIRH